MTDMAKSDTGFVARDRNGKLYWFRGAPEYDFDAGSWMDSREYPGHHQIVDEAGHYDDVAPGQVTCVLYRHSDLVTKHE